MDLVPKEIWKLQKLISKAGFVITDVVPGFNRYHPRKDMVHLAASVLRDPTSSWFRSSWIRLEAAQLPLKSKVKVGADIYAYADSN